MNTLLGSADPSYMLLAGVLLLLSAWPLLSWRADPGLLRPGRLKGGPLTVRAMAGVLLAALAYLVGGLLELLWEGSGGVVAGTLSGGGATLAAVLQALSSSQPLSVAAVLSSSLSGFLSAAGSDLWTALLLGGIAGAISAGGRWSPSGVMAWLGLALLSAGFVLYGVDVLEAAGGPIAFGLASLVLVSETGGLGLLLCYQFYALEFLTGQRRADSPLPAGSGSLAARPRAVGVQIPCYNEPAELVIGCLDSVLALDHPRSLLHVQVLDDSTDLAAVAAVSAYCRAQGVQYIHRAARRGFKAGALNDGLRSMPQEVEFLAVVDADYEVEAGFLREVLPLFERPRVAFVQTPQSYRNAGAGPLARLYALADAYFYRVVEPVRDRAGSAIFCGTMGVVRRSALESAGGWNESSITEDAELSLRLYAAGWTSVYLPKVLGRGLAPLTFEDLRSQHARWAFGGLQMLRLDRSALGRGRLTIRQRADFLLGGAFWLDGTFLLGMSLSIALLVVAGLFGVGLPTLSYGSLALVASAPVLLLLDSALKVRLALRSVQRTSLRDALGVLGFWYAIKLNDLRAAVRGLVGGPMAFRRTPKTGTGPLGSGEQLLRAIRSSRWETTLALGFWMLGVLFGLYEAGTSLAAGQLPPVTLLLLVAWTLFYAVAFASAPRLAVGALRALARSSGTSPSEESPAAGARRTPGHSLDVLPLNSSARPD